MPTVTIGATKFEVYRDLAGLKAYYAGTANAAGFNAASGAAVRQAQVQATRLLDRQRWLGAPTQPISKVQPQPIGTQPLAWPRTGLVDRDGNAVPSASIPLDVLDAYAEVVNALLLDPAFETFATTGSNTRRTRARRKVDVVEKEDETEAFFPTLTLGTRFPTVIDELIGLYLASHRIGTTGSAFVTGTGETSPFANGGSTFEFETPGLP